ncbi:MAG TPA: ribose-phosphate diphosphokinase [Tenericutes bacterium]|nr:ribose-phosphate diphosphokinase [Mycoplasmatota bacterium]
MNNMKLIVMENCKELGEKVDEHLKRMNHNGSYIASISNERFSNGEGKIKINETVREKDLYIITDIGNYSQYYKMHGQPHYMSPDEHYQDVKRVISATCGGASKITLIMPLLYQSRQDKRKGRESLDCAIALQELEQLGVNTIVTFDAHNPGICNAIPKLPFENFYPTHIILEKFIENETEDIGNLLVFAPDMGATERARYYAEMLGCDMGAFYKRRDLSKVVNGKNPIIDHVYMGPDIKGKNAIIVDDMIASGQSMIEVAELLKDKGAKNIYLVATFALLTEGVENFVKAYEKGIFTKLYSTNLSYVPEKIKKERWYCDVDCSYQIAQIINYLNNKKSLAPLYNGKKDILDKIERVMVKCE